MAKANYSRAFQKKEKEKTPVLLLLPSFSFLFFSVALGFKYLIRQSQNGQKRVHVVYGWLATYYQGIICRILSALLWKYLNQWVTTHDIRCTKGLDIRLISGWYPWYRQENIAVFIDFSRFYPLTTVHWCLANVQEYPLSSRFFLVFCWNLSDI